MARPVAMSRSSLALDNLRAVVILIVLAFHSVLAYVRCDYLALPFWPNGQLWFLWQLLALNIIVVGVNWVTERDQGARPLVGGVGPCPSIYLAALIAASALAYVPLALAFTPWAWSDSGPLAIQFARPLLYAVYFFAGVGIGAGGIDNELVAADGGLAQRWWLWLAGAVAALFLWMGLTSLTLDGPAPIPIEIASDLSFVLLACAAGCSFLLAAALRFGLRRSRARAYLSANAYSLYLVHYVFVVWLQYALLGSALFAVIKGPIVFSVTLAISWIEK